MDNNLIRYVASDISANVQCIGQVVFKKKKKKE